MREHLRIHILCINAYTCSYAGVNIFAYDEGHRQKDGERQLGKHPPNSSTKT